MKTQYQGQQNHYEDIDCFIHNDPANGAKKNLDAVRNYSHRVRQPDSAAVQFRFENCWHNTRCSIAFCLSATETPGLALSFVTALALQRANLLQVAAASA